jgi:hypothetical protein
MICSPCKECLKKNLPKDKCIKRCKILKRIQEMDSSLYQWNEGCGIDYTVVYSIHIPATSASSSQ